MPFATVAVPFDAYAALPTPQHRWILMCLARYTDRNGVCWPSMRQLAADARVSPATICRRLKDMADLGVFQRERRGVGRYRYTLAEAYVPRWNPRVSLAPQHVSPAETLKQPTKQNHKNYDGREKYRGDIGVHSDSSQRLPTHPGENPSVVEAQRVHHDQRHRQGQQQRHDDLRSHSNILSDTDRWEPRLRAWTRSRFWLPMWGPKPTEPGCWAPQAFAAAPC